MDRNATEQLLQWKNRRNRKPLLLKGARQTGKTWLLKDFGNREFKNLAYVDLLENPRARKLFDEDFDLTRIISGLEVECSETIKLGETLVVLDEIQESPRALSSLKYFQQNMPGLHVAAAGSYLGIAKHAGESFPVGKVDDVKVSPLAFDEFLNAVGENTLAAQLQEGRVANIDSVFFDKLKTLLKEYMFVGGMPEVVKHFASEHDFSEARRLQMSIIEAYDGDFSKHAPSKILERMRLVWSSLPGQLAKENRKFVYGAVRPSGRARDFEESIMWLSDYGAATKVLRASALREPLSGYANGTAFKLFCVDVGLLGALAELDASSVLDESRIFTEFKGALTEQYVCQQLVAQGIRPFYWSAERSEAEVDFAISVKGIPVPIEVKAAENLKAKSLAIARDKFNLKRCVRTSLSGYRDDGWLINIPLWAMSNINKLKLVEN